MDKVKVKLDPLDRMALADSLSYLTDDILQKVDRAAMAVALETRVPFLDKDVVEFAARVPPGMKVRDGRGKWLVRQVLYRHVPAESWSTGQRPVSAFPIDDLAARAAQAVGSAICCRRTEAASPGPVQCRSRL